MQEEDELLYELPVYDEVDEVDYCLLLPWKEYLNAVEGKSKNLILYIMWCILIEDLATDQKSNKPNAVKGTELMYIKITY